MSYMSSNISRTFAVLNAGISKRSINVQNLCQRPHIQTHAFVRDQSKLTSDTPVLLMIVCLQEFIQINCHSRALRALSVRAWPENPACESHGILWGGHNFLSGA